MADVIALNDWPSTSAANMATDEPSCSSPSVERPTAHGPKKTGVIDVHYVSPRKESRMRYFAILSERSLDFHKSEKTWRKNKRGKHIIDLGAALNVSLQKFGNPSSSWVVVLAPNETFILRADSESHAQTLDWYDKIRATLVSARLIKFGRHTNEIELFKYTWDVRVRAKPKSEHAGALRNICVSRPELTDQHYRLCAYADTLLLCQAGAVLNAGVRSYPPLLEQSFTKFSWGSVNYYGSSNKYFFFRYNQSYEVFLECFTAPCSSSTIAREVFERIRELTESERARLNQLARISVPMGLNDKRSCDGHRRVMRDGRPSGECSIQKAETSNNRCDTCNARVFVAAPPSTGSGVDEETEGSGGTLRESCGYCRQREEIVPNNNDLSRPLSDLDLSSPYVEMNMNGSHFHELRSAITSAKSVSRINSRASLNAPSEDGVTVVPNSPQRLASGDDAAVAAPEECASENLSTTSSSISANAPTWSGSADISSIASSRLSTPPFQALLHRCEPSLPLYHDRTASCSATRPIIEENTVVPQPATSGCENAPSSIGSIDDNASYSSSAPYLSVPIRCRDDGCNFYNSDSADSSYYSVNGGLPNQRAVSFTSGVTRPVLQPYRNGYATVSEHEIMEMPSTHCLLPVETTTTVITTSKPQPTGGKRTTNQSSILENDDRIDVLKSIIVKESSRSARNDSNPPAGNDDNGRWRTLSLGNMSWRSLHLLLPRRKTSTKTYCFNSRTSKNDPKGDRTIVASAQSPHLNGGMLAPSRVVLSSAHTYDEARQRRQNWRSIELSTYSNSNTTDYTTTIASPTAVLPGTTISPSSSIAASSTSIVHADSVGSHSAVKVGRIGGFGSVSVAGFPMFDDCHSLKQSDLHPTHVLNSKEVQARCFISEEDNRKLDQLTRSAADRWQTADMLAAKKARAKRRAARNAKAVAAPSGNGEEFPVSGSISGASSAVGTAFGFETIAENNSGRTSPVNTADNGVNQVHPTESTLIKTQKSRVRLTNTSSKACAGINGGPEPAVKIAV